MKAGLQHVNNKFSRNGDTCKAYIIAE